MTTLKEQIAAVEVYLRQNEQEAADEFFHREVRFAASQRAAALRAALDTLRACEWVRVEDCPEEWKDGRPVELYRPAAGVGRHEQRVVAVWFDFGEGDADWIWPDDVQNDGWWGVVSDLVEEDAYFEAGGTFTHVRPLHAPPEVKP